MGDLTYLLINIAGVVVFLGIAILISKNRKDIPWISVGILLAITVLLAFFFLKVPAGQAAIKVCTDGFTLLMTAAMDGVTFAFSDALTSTSTALTTATVDNGVITAGTSSAVFFASALLPILVIVPLFDILNYLGILPWIIKVIGKGVAIVTREPKFESFFAIEMMFLGNADSIAVSRFQLVKMNKERNLTIAMMSMSCVSASLIGAYSQMLPGEYILTAIPLNVINALLMTSLINPIKVEKRDDFVVNLYEKGQKKEAFFAFLGTSITNSGKLILIITANVIAFVGLSSVINLLLGCFNPLIHMVIDWDLSFQTLLGLIMYIPACLMGLPIGGAETLDAATNMGTKLVLNEFVVMGSLQPVIGEYSQHFQCVMTVYLTSFANLSTLGLILGVMKGILSENKVKHVAKNIGYMFISGVLVSCLSASVAGLFVW